MKSTGPHQKHGIHKWKYIRPFLFLACTSHICAASRKNMISFLTKYKSPCHFYWDLLLFWFRLQSHHHHDTNCNERVGLSNKYNFYDGVVNLFNFFFFQNGWMAGKEILKVGWYKIPVFCLRRVSSSSEEWH